MRSYQRLPLAWLGVFFSACTAHAATLYLTDGKTIQGTIVGASERQIEIRTAAGTVTLAPDRVQRVDYTGDSVSVSVPLPRPPAAPPEQPPPSPYSPHVRVYRRVDEPVTTK